QHGVDLRIIRVAPAVNLEIQLDVELVCHVLVDFLHDEVSISFLFVTDQCECELNSVLELRCVSWRSGAAICAGSAAIAAGTSRILLVATACQYERKCDY